MDAKWFFGQWIERILYKRDLRPADLARMTGLSRAYVSYLINGKTPDRPNPPSPTIDTLLTLSKSLRVPVMHLILAYEGKDPDAAYANEADPDAAAAEDMEEVLEQFKEFLKGKRKSK